MATALTKNEINRLSSEYIKENYVEFYHSAEYPEFIKRFTIKMTNKLEDLTQNILGTGVEQMSPESQKVILYHDLKSKLEEPIYDFVENVLEDTFSDIPKNIPDFMLKSSLLNICNELKRKGILEKHHWGKPEFAYTREFEEDIREVVKKEVLENNLAPQ